MHKVPGTGGEKNESRGSVFPLYEEQYRLRKMHDALFYLDRALEAVKLSCAVETPHAIRRAIKSCGGAIRHQERRIFCQKEGRPLKRRGGNTR